MKITKSQLRRIIKEEIKRIDENTSKQNLRNASNTILSHKLRTKSHKIGNWKFELEWDNKVGPQWTWNHIKSERYVLAQLFFDSMNGMVISVYDADGDDLEHYDVSYETKGDVEADYKWYISTMKNYLRKAEAL